MKQTLLFLFVFVTVGTAQLKTPDWAKRAVWYQIFPDRFRNGDPSNDPTPPELEQASDWKVSPWTGDWYALQPWEKARTPDFYRNVFDRRYGGDLKGVIDKLDYLSKLGITAIYFNPVFEAFSLHKYDASTYHHIDNNFGPRPAADLALMASETDDPATWHWTSADSLFLQLIREAHRRNIRVIIDGVFNHSGTRCFAFQDIALRQKQSRYAEWYDVTTWDNPTTPANEFQYKGWWGNESLPEFKEDSNGFVPAVKQYFFNITRRWMDPNGDGNPSDGIDGWRLDVANEVSHQFWKEWRKVVKGANPNGYIVAELWDNARDWLQGDEFDGAMNYVFARASVQFFINTSKDKLSASEFANMLTEARKNYPDEANSVLQNLFDSHDTDRLLSMIANPNRQFDRDNGLRSAPDYDISKPGPAARDKLKLMVLFQMTYPGAPMIYYGSEAGMWGADDPDDRKPMIWSDLAYDDEASHPVPGKTRRRDPVRFDEELFAYYQKLISIRTTNAALNFGSFNVLLTDDGKDVLAFERAQPDAQTIVVLNNGDRNQSIELNAGGVFINALTKEEIIAHDGKITVKVKAGTGALLIKMAQL